MYKISANTLFIGQDYIYLPVCHSTNSEAFEYLGKNRVSDGMVLNTSNQTAGRGQRGNIWRSAPDQNLTFSVVLKPAFLRAQEQFRLNMAVSMALADLLADFSRAIKIKWPNDIYADNKKLAGILIEIFLKNAAIESAITGIGLNVNQTDFGLPGITSLSALTGRSYELQPLLETLCEKLENRYLQLRQGNYEKIKQDYLQQLYWYQEEHLFEDLRQGDRKKFAGTILGIDTTGKLAVQTSSKIEHFSFKEIRFVQ